MNPVRIQLLTLSLATILGACSSHKPKVAQVDDLSTKLDRITPVSGENIGLRDGVVVVQRRQPLSEDLRKLQLTVYSLEDEIYGSREFGKPGYYGVLKKCMAQVADKRLGGPGKLSPLEPEDRPTDRETDVKFGLDEKNQLVTFNEENVAERMARFLDYKRILLQRRSDFERRIDVCDNEYKMALVDRGLDPADTQTTSNWIYNPDRQGYEWKMTHAATSDLDELGRRARSRTVPVSTPQTPATVPSALEATPVPGATTAPSTEPVASL